MSQRQDGYSSPIVPLSRQQSFNSDFDPHQLLLLSSPLSAPTTITNNGYTSFSSPKRIKKLQMNEEEEEQNGDEEEEELEEEKEKEALVLLTTFHANAKRREIENSMKKEIPSTTTTTTSLVHSSNTNNFGKNNHVVVTSDQDKLFLQKLIAQLSSKQLEALLDLIFKIDVDLVHIMEEGESYSIDIGLLPADVFKTISKFVREALGDEMVFTLKENSSFTVLSEEPSPTSKAKQEEQSSPNINEALRDLKPLDDLKRIKRLPEDQHFTQNGVHVIILGTNSNQENIFFCSLCNTGYPSRWVSIWGEIEFTHKHTGIILCVTLKPFT